MSGQPGLPLLSLASLAAVRRQHPEQSLGLHQPHHVTFAAAKSCHELPTANVAKVSAAVKMPKAPPTVFATRPGSPCQALGTTSICLAKAPKTPHQRLSSSLHRRQGDSSEPCFGEGTGASNIMAKSWPTLNQLLCTHTHTRTRTPAWPGLTYITCVPRWRCLRPELAESSLANPGQLTFAKKQTTSGYRWKTEL